MNFYKNFFRIKSNSLDNFIYKSIKICQNLIIFPQNGLKNRLIFNKITVFINAAHINCLIRDGQWEGHIGVDELYIILSFHIHILRIIAAYKVIILVT